MIDSTTKAASESAREFSPLTEDAILNAEGPILISRFDTHWRPREGSVWIHRYYFWSPFHNRLWSVEAGDPSSLTVRHNPSSYDLECLASFPFHSRPGPIFTPLDALPASFERYYKDHHVLRLYQEHSKTFAERLAGITKQLHELLEDVNRERKEALAEVQKHFRTTAKPRLGEELLGLAKNTFRHHS